MHLDPVKFEPSLDAQWIKVCLMEMAFSMQLECSLQFNVPVLHFYICIVMAICYNMFGEILHGKSKLFAGLFSYLLPSFILVIIISYQLHSQRLANKQKHPLKV